MENGSSRFISEIQIDFLIYFLDDLGAGIHVAVFDTGIQDGHPHFPNIAEVTNWTDEKNDHDSMKQSILNRLIHNLIFIFSDWSRIVRCRYYW